MLQSTQTFRPGDHIRVSEETGLDDCFVLTQELLDHAVNYRVALGCELAFAGKHLERTSRRIERREKS